MTCCIEWTGYRDAQGYGRTKLEGKRQRAHRVAYVQAKGLALRDIEGLCVLHSCDNPPCINPKHLRLGSRKDNANDMVRRGRQAKGETSGRAKFTDQDITKVRMLRDGGLTYRQIAARTGISRTHVGHIVRGHSR